jgi:hypothetical protein
LEDKPDEPDRAEDEGREIEAEDRYDGDDEALNLDDGRETEDRDA